VIKQPFIWCGRLGATGIVVFLASIALSQETSPTPAAIAEMERVIVTGSYIPTAETETALPVTVYTAEVLQKQGANTPIEGLRQLPSFVGNTATENDSNGGDGQAHINLTRILDCSMRSWAARNQPYAKGSAVSNSRPNRRTP
jgi:hypothetical protein